MVQGVARTAIETTVGGRVDASRLSRAADVSLTADGRRTIQPPSTRGIARVDHVKPK
jgi:hypothetical protein